MTDEAFKIFIVEDDEMYGELIRYHLSLNPDYQPTLFKTGKEFLKELHQKPAVVTLDYSLPDISGQEVLQKVREFDPEIPVVIISGQEDIGTAVKLLRQGAYDYLTKDEDTKDRLWNTIKNLREKLQLQDEITSLKEEIGHKYEFDKTIIGNSPAIKKTFFLMEKGAKTNITVSVSGETGTGKELVAKAIHYNSNRKNKPFVAVNVSAIPKDLIESELFGHEKGAFTGASTRRIGKFEEAHEGTIFLDEIAEIDIHLQTKLLRVLQEREINRIGSNKTIKIDTRLIVATNKNLAEEVKKGNFREDLYYRILGLPINLPPLRERGNDILLLAKHFVEEFCRENKLPPLQLSTKAREKLLKYPYPGNVRELKAIIELATVMTNNDMIEEDDITFHSTTPMSDLLLEETTLKEYNYRIIKHFLNKYDDNVVLVAKKLGIGKSTIYRMLKKRES